MNDPEGLITLRLTTEIERPWRTRFFQVEGSAVTGALLPYGDEVNGDFFGVTQRTGVYILKYAVPNGEKPEIYIGFANRLSRRLLEHRKEGVWEQTILLASNLREMTEDHFRTIESSLISAGSSSDRVQLANTVIPTPPTLSAADRRAVERYVQTAIDCLNLFGIDLREYPLPLRPVDLGLSPFDELADMDHLELFERLSVTLGIQIRRIIWYHADPSTFVYLTRRGRFEVRSLENLQQLRRKCKEATGHKIPRLNAELWRVTTQAIVRAAIVYDLVANPWTGLINPEVVVGAYLALRPPGDVPSTASDPTQPYSWDQCVRIIKSDLEVWCARYMWSWEDRDKLGEDLIRMGWRQTEETSPLDGDTQSVTVLVSPFRWKPPIQWGAKQGA